MTSRLTISDINNLAQNGKIRGYKVNAPKPKESAVKRKEHGKAVSFEPKQTEHQLQCSEFEWFSKTYPQYKMRLFAIPNSGKRHIAVAVKMKKEGQVSGAWDVLLSVTRHTEDGFYGGLFIENKVGKNTLTDNQKAFYEANKHEYQFQVAHTLEEFKFHIVNYLS